MIYKFESRVRYSETDCDKKLSLNSLIDYFQDCATFHSEDIGMGFDYLEKNSMMWMLAGWQIVIDRYPDVCEKITIATWPYAFRSFYGERNLAMYGADGKMAAYANSLWILVNLKTGHPMKPTEQQREAYGLEPKLDMDYEPRKIKIAGECEIKPAAGILKHQIDSNGHVNNGQYVLMAREYLPEEFIIRQVRVEYKNAATLEDTVIPSLYRGEESYTVKLDGKNGNTFAIVEFK